MSRNWTVMSVNLVTFSPTSPVGGGCRYHLRLLGSGGGPDSGKAGDVDSGFENVALRLVHAHVGDAITTVAAHPALQSRNGTVTRKSNDCTVGLVSGLGGTGELRAAGENVTELSTDEVPSR